MKQILYEDLSSIWQIVDMLQSVETMLENISDCDDFLDKSILVYNDVIKIWLFVGLLKGMAEHFALLS